MEAQGSEHICEAETHQEKSLFPLSLSSLICFFVCVCLFHYVLNVSHNHFQLGLLFMWVHAQLREIHSSLVQRQIVHTAYAYYQTQRKHQRKSEKAVVPF